MAVAAAASHRQTEPNRAGRLCAVEGVFALILLGDSTSFTGTHIVANVTRSDLLVG